MEEEIKRFFALMHEVPDYPTAVVMLIDALRGYILADEEIESEARMEGWTRTVTVEQTRKWAAHMQMMRLLLKELEGCEINPSLNGNIEWKP